MSMSCAVWSVATRLPSHGGSQFHLHGRNLMTSGNSQLRSHLAHNNTHKLSARRIRLLHCTSMDSRFVPPTKGMEGLRTVALELQDEADFASVANGDGEISICGFGSLLSEKSALYTFPNLLNFRVAVLRDFRRVFAHVAPVFLDRGIANVETKELSSLSVEPCVGESIVVTVFEISVAEVPAFIEREHEFRFLAITVEDKDGKPFSQRAVVCSRYSDEEYRRIRCQGSKEEYHKRYGRHKIEQIWRDDIFPCRVYLRHCVLAAKNLGMDAYDNFLDHTYLGDRTITIRKYFETGLGVGVMDEQPPEALRDRYGG